mgnify:FL=1
MSMNEKQFRQTLDELRATNSRNDKKELIAEVSDSPAAISFLSGSEFDSIGLGRKSVKKAVPFDGFEDDGPTISESLEEYDCESDGKDMETLYQHINVLDSLSGNEQIEYLSGMFESYTYPSVVSFALMNDIGVGVGDSTIAKALNLEDSLPFVESVVDATKMESPPSTPVVGQPFSPMLAVPEKRSPEFKEE